MITTELDAIWAVYFYFWSASDPAGKNLDRIGAIIKCVDGNGGRTAALNPDTLFILPPICLMFTFGRNENSVLARGKGDVLSLHLNQMN
jgi:hypothetical protein